MSFTEKFYKEVGFLKNIYITQDKIMASDEDYGDMETFLSKLNAEKKAMLDTHVKFGFDEIIKFILFEEENGIQIFYKTGNKEEKTYLQFSQEADYKEVLDYLKQKCNQFQPKEEQSGSIVAIIKPLLYTLAAICFSFALVFAASEIEAGETIAVDGSKRGLKRLLISLAATLGFGGSLAVAIIVVLGFIFYSYKTYKNSKKIQIVYSL